MKYFLTKKSTIRLKKFFFKFLGTNLLKFFSDYNLKTIITTWDNGSVFNTLQGFSMLSLSSNTVYYVVDSNKIFMFNDNWTFLGYKLLGSPNYIISDGINMFITGDSRLLKTDGNLNILNQYNAASSPHYRGIYYNSTTGLIYVAAYWLTAIHVFDTNLVLTGNISTKNNAPYSISGYNGQLYVGTYSGSILVIFNSTMIDTFNGCYNNLAIVNFITFDSFKNMATICSNNQMYLYDSIGNFNNKSIATLSNPGYIGFDSKRRFVLISSKQVSLYS